MNLLKTYSKRIAWCAPLLLTALVAACGGGDGRDPILGTGDIAQVFTPGLIVDTTPPRVIATAAYKNNATTPTATGLSINRNVTTSFSEAMDPATLTAASFTLSCASPCVAPAGVVSYGDRTATFNPNSDLDINTTYTSTITTGAKDLAGNAMAAPYVWSWTTGATADNVAPIVLSTSPADGAVDICSNKTINATFSEEMYRNSISTTTFTLMTTAGSVPVTGLVTYDAVTDIASFNPSTDLALATNYTATIKGGATGVEDLAGNTMAVDKVVTFTTSATSCTVPVITPVALGTIETYGSFGGSAGMTNSGLLTVVNGNIGTTAVSTALTGFHDAGPGCTYTETPLNVGTVNGKIYTAAPPPTVACPTEGTATTFAIATQARADALAAYNELVAKPVGGASPQPPANLATPATSTLFPGTYKSASGSYEIVGGDLTLDAQGDANAVWVFQMATTLTVGGPGAPQSIILAGGAQAKNVFWQVGSAATINAAGGGTMVGTIIAQDGAAFSTAGNVAVVTLEGRAVSLGASVTLVNTVINVPQ